MTYDWPATLGAVELGLVAAVVVDGGPKDHAEDPVAVGERVRQAPQHDDGRPVAEDGAARLLVEGPRVAVGRQHRAFLVDIPAPRRRRDGNAPGESKVALAGTKALEGLGDGDERRRAGGVDRDGGAGQVELVGDAGRDVVLLVRDREVELSHAVHEVRAGEDVVVVIARRVHPAEDSDEPGEGLGNVPGALERLPRQLEEHAVLGVHHLGFRRRDAEEGGVEEVVVVDDPACRHVGRVARRARGKGGVELVRGEERDRLLRRTHVPPEFLHVPRAGQPARHADDGDRLERAGGGRRNAEPRFGLTVERRRQRLGRRVLEDAHHRDLDAEPLAEPEDDPVGEQRVAAQLEEAVADADRIDAEDLGIGRADSLLLVRAGSGVGYG